MVRNSLTSGTSIPLMNAQGEVTHWVSYQRDVTEKKESGKGYIQYRFRNATKAARRIHPQILYGRVRTLTVNI